MQFKLYWEFLVIKYKFFQVNRGEIMFKIKRPVIIGLLLVLLVFTTYLNYELTQQALRKTSKGYQKHEEAEKAQHEENHYALEEDKEEDFEIIDPEGPIEEDIDKENEEDEDIEDNISDTVSTGNKSIDEAISKEVSATSKNYFVDYRLSRDKLRANLVDRLETIVNNDNTNDEMRTEAQDEIVNIGKISENELQLEGLIKSKGFDEVLVFLTDEDIKVIVSSEKLEENDM